MWSDRVDHLKKLRAGRSRQPYEWLPAADLVPGDLFEYGGNWFRVLDLLDSEPYVQAAVDLDHRRTVVDYLAFELVKVAMPRPEGSWTTGPAA